MKHLLIILSICLISAVNFAATPNCNQLGTCNNIEKQRQAKKSADARHELKYCIAKVFNTAAAIYEKKLYKTDAILNFMNKNMNKCIAKYDKRTQNCGMTNSI